MAASGELKARIQLLQAAQARAAATGKALKPEIQRELESYAEQGLLGSTATAAGYRPATREGEDKANAFLIRALGANRSYERTGVGPRSTLGQNIADSLPNLANSAPTWLGGNSDDRQVADTSQDEFIAASLRQDSGAAIPDDELTRQRRIYFPMPGDSEKAIDAKAAARRRVIEGLVAAAGRAVQPALLQRYPEYFPEAQQEGGGPASATEGAAGGSAPPAGPSGTPPSGPAADEAGPLVAGDVAQESAATRTVELTQAQRDEITRVAENGGSASDIDAVFRRFGLSPRDDGATARWVEARRKDPRLPWRFAVDNSQQARRPEDRAGVNGTSDLRGIIEGVASNVPFIREAAAVVDTVGNGGTYEDALERRRGERLWITENSPWAYAGGAALGALPGGGIGMGSARAVAASAGRTALRAGATMAEARAAANRAFAMQTALAAGGQGGVYSFGNADGSFVERVGEGVAGAGIGAVAGGALSYGGGRVANALRGRAGRLASETLTDGQDALAAADRLEQRFGQGNGIIPFPADVGSGATRRATSVAAQTLGGNSQIVAGAQRTINSAQGVRDRVAASVGTPVGLEEAGETARAGARQWIAETGQRVGRIFDRADAAGGRVAIDATDARRVLDQELAPLAESPVQGPGVAILQSLREALDQPQTVRGLRNARSQIRDQFENAGLRGSNVERIASRVINAATDDLVNGLRAQGLDAAARQYRVADRLWRQRLETIDENLEPILGAATGPGMRSGEEIVRNLTQAMAGNNRRFSGFIDALPANEQGIVRASLIQRLGMATRGNQDETGELFSLNTFLSNWNNIGNRAKDRLFGAEGRAALNDLATYASSARQASRYANTSNSGGVGINWFTALSGAGAWGSLGATVIAENLTGRLLASPRYARWLARAPRVTTPQQRQAHLSRLSRIARAEPAIANEVLQLQQRLAAALEAAPMRAAADEGGSPPAPVYRYEGQDDSEQQRTQP